MADHLQQIPLETAERFSALVLSNVVREYPNHLSHVLTSPMDSGRPRELHPIFFGCFDWHSCVHGYWLLARLHRTIENLSKKEAIEQQFDLAFTEENVSGEMRYLTRPANRGFERPYGWGWLLMLCHELSLHRHEKARRWYWLLKPMADLFVNRFLDYLPKADYPVRMGAHLNSAFATVLALKFAHSHENHSLSEILESKAREWYLDDVDCQVWEPSQSDFLSPALMEAHCMSHVLPREEFLVWFGRFLPQLCDRKPAVLFNPANVSDPEDGQISHLHGLNLSRAWSFRAIAAALPENQGLSAVLRSAAESHLDASLPHVFGNYAGEHWLATFAALALSL